MTENKYKNPQASKQLWHKSTLKSILFCGLIGIGMIGTNEVCGSNASKTTASKTTTKTLKIGDYTYTNIPNHLNEDTFTSIENPIFKELQNFLNGLQVNMYNLDSPSSQTPIPAKLWCDFFKPDLCRLVLSGDLIYKNVIIDGIGKEGEIITKNRLLSNYFISLKSPEFDAGEKTNTGYDNWIIYKNVISGATWLISGSLTKTGSIGQVLQQILNSDIIKKLGYTIGIVGLSKNDYLTNATGCATYNIYFDLFNPKSHRNGKKHKGPAISGYVTDYNEPFNPNSPYSFRDMLENKFPYSYLQGLDNRKFRINGHIKSDDFFLCCVQQSDYFNEQLAKINNSDPLKKELSKKCMFQCNMSLTKDNTNISYNVDKLIFHEQYNIMDSIEESVLTENYDNIGVVDIFNNYNSLSGRMSSIYNAVLEPAYEINKQLPSYVPQEVGEKKLGDIINKIKIRLLALDTKKPSIYDKRFRIKYNKKYKIKNLGGHVYIKPYTTGIILQSEPKVEIKLTTPSLGGHSVIIKLKLRKNKTIDMEILDGLHRYHVKYGTELNPTVAESDVQKDKALMYGK